MSTFPYLHVILQKTACLPEAASLRVGSGGVCRVSRRLAERICDCLKRISRFQNNRFLNELAFRWYVNAHRRCESVSDALCNRRDSCNNQQE